MIRLGMALLAAAILGACSEQASTSLPQPIALTAQAAGHYCQMTVLDHPGPKAQVHLAGNPHPLWFTQVRDALAFDRMPEEPADTLVIYVNDMAQAESWEHPGTDNWIPAQAASYVVGSAARGGMGAPELVPFGTRQAASRFAQAQGGRVLAYAELTDALILAPVDVELAPATNSDGPMSKPHHGNVDG